VTAAVSPDRPAGDAGHPPETAVPARSPGRIRTRMLAAIHEAAVQVFARDGYQGASTQAIADAAGISKPQLHYYIGSKEALYTRILQEIVDDWISVFGFAEAKYGPARVISDYVRRKMIFSFDHPERSRIFTAEIMRGAPVLQTLMGTSHRRTEQAVAVLQNWIDAGLMAPVDPLLLMFHVWSITQHYADYQHQVAFFRGPSAHTAADREKLIAEVTQFILRGAGVQPSAAG
jgi:TetR/AcrR family transcriptional regulator